MTLARFVKGYGLTGLNIFEFYWRLGVILGLEQQASNHLREAKTGSGVVLKFLFFDFFIISFCQVYIILNPG